MYKKSSSITEKVDEAPERKVASEDLITLQSVQSTTSVSEKKLLSGNNRFYKEINVVPFSSYNE